jgi:hypothetical protein
MTALPFLFTLVGFVCFALATEHHHRSRLNRRCTPRAARNLRTLAWTSLSAAFALSISVWGPIYAPIGWTAALMLAGATTTLSLNLLPDGLKRVGKLGNDGSPRAK